MNILRGLQSVGATFLLFLQHFYDSIFFLLEDVAAHIFYEVMRLCFTLLNSIPVPDALANWSWPAASGQWVGLLFDCGVDVAIQILAGAMLIKLALKLTILLA